MSEPEEVVMYYRLKGRALALKARAKALHWVRRNYDVSPDEAYKNMLDYLFGGNEDLAVSLSAFELAFGKDLDDESADIVHEMVEASEIKRKFGYVEFRTELRDYAHPIAFGYELRFLKNIGRWDLMLTRTDM